MEFLEPVWEQLWWIGLCSMVIASVIGWVHRHWQRRRVFYRMGEGGIESFKSYAVAVRVRAFELSVRLLVGIICAPFALGGFALLVLGLVVLANGGEYTYEEFREMIDQTVEWLTEEWDQLKEEIEEERMR